MSSASEKTELREQRKKQQMERLQIQAKAKIEAREIRESERNAEVAPIIGSTKE